MLQLKFLRTNTKEAIEGLFKRKNLQDLDKIVAQAIEKDDERKAKQTQLDAMLAEQNKWAKEIGTLMRTGDVDGAEKQRKMVQEQKEACKDLEDALRQIKMDLDELLLQIPNVPHPSVPAGRGEQENEVFQDWAGSLDPDGAFQRIPHWEIGAKLDILDLPLGSKITGSGFPLYKGKGARLQRALISFFLDEAGRSGFSEIIPPYLVNAQSARATGQLPDKESQMYYMPEDDFYLIPTGEVPITNIYRDGMLKTEDLPIKLCGYTPCFRREAGSYGADVKGLNRVHQFDKVEIVVIDHPDHSYDMLLIMMDHVKSLLEKLNLPYRILRLCGGDLGFTSALTYDFEIYSQAQKKWLEVSSVSNFETYQSHRLNLKFKDGGKPRLTHTLNGSALALARIYAGILENHQTKEGHIRIPEVLTPYTGFDMITE